MTGKSVHGRLALLVLGWTIHGAGAEPPLTLEEAIQTALASNRTLRLLELDLESRQLGVREARAEFSFQGYPQGQVATDQEGGQSSYGMRISKKQGSGAAWQAEGRWDRVAFSNPPDLNRGVVRVEVRQPLLRRFGRLVHEEPIEQARSSARAAQREIEMRRADLVVEVVEGYENLLRLQRQRQFDTQALQRSEQLLRLTRARERQGRATRVDVLRVELQDGENRIRATQTLESLANARAAFAELLGLAPDAELTVRPTPQLEITPPDRTEALHIALAHRLDYAQVLADQRDLERGIRIARRNLWPDLELIARYERSAEGARVSDAFDFDTGTWFVGLSAGHDIRRVRERLALSQALLRGERGRQALEILRSALARQVQQVLSAYERARQEAQVAEHNHLLAERRARLARRQFEMGRGDNFTATDAENALLEAHNRMLRSQAEISIAAYRLLRALGTLLEYPAELTSSAEDEANR